MLGVFWLPAFTDLGLECQDCLSPCDGMHVRTDKTSVYTLTRESFYGKEPEPISAPREKSVLASGIGSSCCCLGRWTSQQHTKRIYNNNNNNNNNNNHNSRALFHVKHAQLS